MLKLNAPNTNYPMEKLNKSYFVPVFSVLPWSQNSQISIADLNLPKNKVVTDGYDLTTYFTQDEPIVNHDFKLDTKRLDQIAPCMLLTFSFEKHPVFKEHSWNRSDLLINNTNISQPKIWCSNTRYLGMEF